MRDNGMIDEATLAKARDAKVNLKDGSAVDEPFGQYFKEHVRVALVERSGASASTKAA